MLSNLYHNRSPTLCFGVSFVLCIDDDNNIWSFGSNYNGKSGFEKADNNFTFPPLKLSSLSNIKSICCGYEHSICIDYDGNVYTFGNNRYGQLGTGKTQKELSHTHIPQKIDLPPIDKISSGAHFNICLSYDNILYSFGKGNKGELGYIEEQYSVFPKVIPNLNNVDFIECGSYFCFCKTIDGDYYSWGENNYGQLGRGTTIASPIPTKCLNWPDNIISITCGVYHTLLLTSDFEVYSFGGNLNGQLGINVQNLYSPKKIIGLPEITRISCGFEHNLLIDIDDNLWTFGYNNNGQLGLGTTTKEITPTKINIDTNIIDISHGGDHTIFRTIDNKIYGCGSSSSCQIGIPKCTEKQLKPIQVLKGYENIWTLNKRRSRAKSARK